MNVIAKMGIALAALAALACTPAPKDPAELPGLKDAYKDAFKIGAAVSSFELSGRNPEYEALILKNFNTLTPGNELKPESLHPRPDVWNWERADRYVDFAVEHDIEVHVQRALQQPLFQQREQEHGAGDQHEADQHALIEARPDRKAHAARGPEAAGRGQARDLPALRDQDGAGAEKADAGDHSRAETHQIGPPPDNIKGVLPEGIQHQIQILAQNGGAGRGHRHQHVGAEACRPAVHLPVQAEEAAQQHRQHDAKAHGTEVQLAKVRKYCVHFAFSPSLYIFCQHGNSRFSRGGSSESARIS